MSLKLFDFMLLFSGSSFFSKVRTNWGGAYELASLPYSIISYDFYLVKFIYYGLLMQLLLCLRLSFQSLMKKPVLSSSVKFITF